MTNTTTNKQMTADEIVTEVIIKAQKAATKHLMMTVSKLPWTREAVVAGGAPRDWYCNRPASDIDVFLTGTTITRRQLELDMKQAVNAVNDLGVENWNLVGMRCWYYIKYASRAFVGTTTIDRTLNQFLEIADCLEGVEDWTV